MTNIEGFVSIGTGGLLNSVVGYNTASGTLVSSGTYYGVLPGSSVAGAPTGWAGTFSGAIGLYGAGVDGISRTGTGSYSVHLSDDWYRLDSVQVTPVGGASLVAGVWSGPLDIVGDVSYHTVGFGNSEAAKNNIYIQFYSPSTGVDVDLPLSSGFFIAIRTRDTSTQPQ